MSLVVDLIGQLNWHVIVCETRNSWLVRFDPSIVLVSLLLVKLSVQSIVCLLKLLKLFLLIFFFHRMEFCTSPAQRSKKQKDVVPDSCYRRLKGILFFNRHTPVSNNKLKILLDERKDLSTALEDASTERRLPQEFRNWLEKCHRELDKEVRIPEVFSL